MNKKLKRGFRHSMLAATVSAVMGVSSIAYAATNNAGSIYGKTEANSQITYKNVNTGVTRTITTSDDGRFNVSSVPTGVYEITDASGNKTVVRVFVGTGSAVNFNDTEVIEVVGGRISVIDVSSSESTEIFDAEEIQNLPLPRNSVNVALLTPGAIQGGASFDRNLPSFGGASIAENGYYIDGMDVTNLRTLLSFAELPYEAIAQTQVKSGGYGVQYGRSLGGIINIVTKSGTNDFEFGGSAYWTPDALRADGKDVFSYKEDGTRTISESNSQDVRDTLRINAYASGPIIEDKLFFYGILEGVKNTRDNYGTTSSYTTKNTKPNYLAKFDWYITPEHLLRFTHINNEEEFDRVNYRYSDPIGDKPFGFHGKENTKYTYGRGGSINILSYTGYLTDDFTLNMMYGTLENKYLKVPPVGGADCPLAFDTSGGKSWSQRKIIGCWNSTRVTDANFPDKDERTSAKIDVEYNFGDHTLRAGYNREEYDSFAPGRTWSGGLYYRYFTAHENNDCTINRVKLPCGTEVVRVRTNNTESGKFGVENTAWYIEDTWQVTENILVNLGVRGETFTNKDSNGKVFLESDNLIAPRVGFVYDVDGDGSKKLYGTLGRYYIPVAANTNIRATRTETATTKFHVYPGGWNDRGEPNGSLGEIVGTTVNDVQTPKPEVIADRNLKPMHQDELIIGYEQEIYEDWTVGVKFLGRTIRDGMDDFCGHDGFIKWAADNGHTKFDPSTMNGCIVINPGRDITIGMDLNNDGNITVQTVPNSYHQLPKYERKYMGLEFTADKQFSDDWKASFSYVLSKTSGNAEGYVNSSLGQEDAGATQDFDHANFMHGSDGDLPTDRRHQFKVNGLYQLSEEFSISANISAVSGTPLSCLGYVSTEGMLKDPSGRGSTAYDFHNFDRYSASSFYCVDEKTGKQVLKNRGSEGRSDWLFNFDMGLNYSPEQVEGLTIRVYVHNVFDIQKADEIVQRKDFAKGNAKVNPDFLRPDGYQPPRYIRLSAHYRF